MKISFTNSCYNIIKSVPKGKVTTYKEIAKKLKSKAYRAVGQAIKNNKRAPIIPCHRVVCSSGKIGGYAFGVNKKIEMLRKEGIEIKSNIINLKRYMHKF